MSDLTLGATNAPGIIPATTLDDLKGYRPVNKRVILLLDKPPEKIGELYLPEQSQAAISTATVICSSSALCEPGDKIACVRWFPMRVENVDIWFCLEADIVAVQTVHNRPKVELQ